jgi:hypothetical protein
MDGGNATFDPVTGVNIFIGDKHTVNRKDIYGDTVECSKRRVIYLLAG